MNDVKLYKKVINGHSLEDYCQWRSIKENELANLEEHTLENMRKYFEYKRRSVENGTIFDKFQANYFSVLGIIVTLIVTLMISFSSNHVNSISGFAIDTDNKEIKTEMIKLYQQSNSELIGLILKIITIFAIVIFSLVLIFFIVNVIYKKRAIASEMYYEEMIKLIDDIRQGK